MSDEPLVKLEPAAGRRVKDPLTGKVLDAAGEMKPLTPYWLRRLSHGDVVKSTTPTTIATKKGDR